VGEGRGRIRTRRPSWCGHGALAHRLHDGTVEVARLIRADELLADQVAADLGYGGSLRRYLSLCQEPTYSRWHWHKRLMATHPPLAHRIALLPPDNAVNGQR